MIVLDASAILMVLFEEPGAARIAAALDDAALSSVNLAEVVSKLVDHGAGDDQIDAVIAQFAPITRPLSVDTARRAGVMRAATRAKGLSMGDRCCLALAQELGAPVLTADRAWAGLELGVEIEVIR